MDLGNSTTTTTVKTPEADTETPTRIQPVLKAPPFTNGVLKRHAPLHLHHHSHHPVVVTYKECLKNHAAALGGHALDGCGEFMPSPASNPAEPTSLKCAACGCHRNFHRKVIVTRSSGDVAAEMTEYGGGGSGRRQMQMAAAYSPEQSSKKRFRTKFTEEQKEKMMGFAEKLEWRLQRKDQEDEIERFCRGVGISRKVFKVWMHNHKNSPSHSSTAGNASSLTDDQ